MKGLPLSYNRDLQEDKPPLFDTADTIKSCLTVLNEMFPGIRFNAERMRETAGDAYSTATDIAEYLVQERGPFQKGTWDHRQDCTLLHQREEETRRSDHK